MYLIGFFALLRHEMGRICRIWKEILLTPIITMTLYFSIFGRLIGSQISSIHGVSYMQYIAPGLIMMTIITSSFSNTVNSLFFLRFQKSIEEILISPLPNYVVLLGLTVGGVIRGILMGVLITCLSLMFVKFHIQHCILTVVTILLTSALFSLAGFLNGLYAKNFEHVAFIPVFILSPLTYLGGIFYSLDMLPHFWKKISLFNPILYIVNTFRYSLLGVSDISIAYSLIVVLLIVLSLFCLCLHLLNNSIGLRG